MALKAVGLRKIWFSITVLLLFCTACGEGSSEKEVGIDGYVYRPELLFTIEGQEPRVYKMKAWGGYLYYVRRNALCRLSVENEVDFTDSREVMEIPAGGMLDYVPGPDQTLYYVAGEERAWDAKTDARGCTMIKRLENGKTEYTRFFPDAAVSGEECLAVNREGWAFLALEDGIYCVDPKGELTDSIRTGEIRKPGMEGELLQGAEGRIYYCVKTSLARYSFYEVVGKDSFQLVKLEGLPVEDITDIYSSEYGLLCDTWGGTLYQYSIDSSGWKMLLQWGDADMYHPVSNTNLIAQISEDRIITYLAVDTGRENREGMSLLTRTPVAELPEREEIVMVSIYPSSELMQMVTEFNRSNSRYHVTVETYLWGELDTKLNSRLVSSSPPDLLDVSRLDVLNYAEKQTFEDLEPYLEGSSLLDREDFMENLLEGYTVDEKLVCVPRCFAIEITTGKTSIIGEEAGWTVKEFMETAEKSPGLRLTDYSSREFMLKGLFKQYLCGHYIDWDTGECRFDGEEFCSFLEWIKYADAVMEDQTENRYWTEERLVTRMEMNSMSDCAKMEVLFGEEVTFKGDPTGDGSVFFPVVPIDAIGIVSGAKHKEGAWEFIEYILSRDNVNSLGIPGRRDIFIKLLEEEMTPEYLITEDGEMVLSMGKPRLKIKAAHGPESIPYYFMTQEQADALLEVLEAVDFTPTGGIKNDIVGIIIEESQSYMEGDRSVEEVARFIQNRVRTLVQENR